ncbi:MAG: acyl-CoA transferase [Desulfovibrio sp.]|nr:acyl-CoA transferase [Desulfovibrio sp.]|tara:strand:- start:1716 stop:2351 length:636 start_codon:yes stop_codon:yes gene_type:complete
MTTHHTIYVLTDTPDLYGNTLIHKDIVPVYVKTIGGLLKRLKDISMAGLVLEIDKVMKAKRRERDRLFNYIGYFPVLRTRANTRLEFITYMDSRQAFFINLEKASGDKARNHERHAVQLDCRLSTEDDPSMAKTIDGTIRDISPGGCFVETKWDMSQELFVHLQIPELSCSRPIFSSIRWGRTERPGHYGMGLMFIDPTDEQVHDIMSMKG